MIIRLAKPSDAASIAILQLTCSKDLIYNLDIKLGKAYLVAYYNILLTEKESIVYCVENKKGEIIGIIAGTTNYNNHQRLLRSQRFKLLLAALPTISLHPRLIKDIFIHTREKKEVGDLKSGKTAHITYWAWMPGAKPPGGAIVLLQVWLETLRLLGVDEVFGDVDDYNVKVIQLHRSLGAQFIGQKEVSPGIIRHKILYNLS